MQIQAENMYINTLTHIVEFSSTFNLGYLHMLLNDNAILFDFESWYRFVWFFFHPAVHDAFLHLIKIQTKTGKTLLGNSSVSNMSLQL